MEHPTPHPVSVASSSTVAAVRTNVAEDGTETFSTTSVTPTIVPQAALASNTSRDPSAPIEEEDDPSIEVSVGAPCKRRGCSAKFVSQEESRLGDGENSLCVYHPSPVRIHDVRLRLVIQRIISLFSTKEVKYVLNRIRQRVSRLLRFFEGVSMLQKTSPRI